MTKSKDESAKMYLLMNRGGSIAPLGFLWLAALQQMMRSRWWLLVIAVIGIAGLAFLYFVNPADISDFPRCPFLVLTGYQCPGCGTLRGIHSLLNFRFREAWNYNPAMVVAIPVIAGLVFSARFRRSVIVSRTILVATLCYWILRNLW